MVEKSVEIEGVGPIWRDPRRNSVQKAVPGVPYGGMATHLVTKRCDLGSLGVPGPASTPLGPGPSLDPGPRWGPREADTSFPGGGELFGTIRPPTTHTNTKEDKSATHAC